MINSEIYDKILLKDNKILSTKQRIIIVTIILLITFVSMTILNITEGFAKQEKLFEYIMQDESANGITVVVAMMISGISYIFPISLICSIVIRFFKNIDTTIKSVLVFLPFYVLLFWAPCVMVSKYIAIWLKIL